MVWGLGSAVRVDTWDVDDGVRIVEFPGLRVWQVRHRNVAMTPRSLRWIG